MAGLSDSQFEQAVIAKGLLTQEQVDKCRSTQKVMAARGIKKTLSQIAVDRKILDSGQLKSIEPKQASGQQKVVEMGGFELISKIGQGGMGAVYKARQKSVDRIVALKVLPPSLAKDKVFIQRFLREARASAALNHPNIVRGIDVGEEGGYYFFAMEYVEGDTASDILKTAKRMKEAQVIEIAVQMASALQHAADHKLVHRDVKPANILIDSTGMAKLVDLGLARQSKDASVTQDGIAMGTPYYISPEQARGEADIDIRADIYALGATLYHLLTGKTPFDGPTAAVVMTKHLVEPVVPPSELNPEVSEGLNQIVLKMMNKEPGDRYQTPNDLIKDLEGLASGKIPVAAPAGGQKNKTDSDGTPRVRTSRKKETVERAKVSRKDARVSEDGETLNKFWPPRLPVLFGAAATVLAVGAIVLFAVTDLEPIKSAEGSGEEGGSVVKVETGAEPVKDGAVAVAKKGSGDKHTSSASKHTTPKTTTPKESGPSPAELLKRQQEKQIAEFDGQLEAIEKEAEENKASPHNYKKIAEKFSKIAADAASKKLLDIEKKAKEKQSLYETLYESASKTAVENARQIADTSSKENLLDALNAYSSVAEKYAGTSAADNARREISKIKKNADKIISENRSLAREAEKNGDFRLAAKYWNKVSRAAYSDRAREDCKQAIARLEFAKVEFEQRRAALFHECRSKLIDSIVKMRLEDATKIISEALKDKRFALIEENLKMSLKDVKHIANLKKQVLAIYKKNLYGNVTNYDKRYPQERYAIAEVSDEAVSLRLAEMETGGTISRNVNNPKDFDYLITADVGTNKVIKSLPPDAKTAIAVYMCYGTDYKSPKAKKAVKTMVEEIKDLPKEYRDHLVSTSRYVADKDVIDSSDKLFAEVRTLFNKAKENLQNEKLVSAAKNKIRRWIKEFYGGHPEVGYVHKQKKEADTMLKVLSGDKADGTDAEVPIEEKPDRPVEEVVDHEASSGGHDIFKGAVTKKTAGGFELFYSAASANMLDDFILKKNVLVKNGKLVSEIPDEFLGFFRSIRLLHKARLSGDAEVTVRFSFGDSPENYIRICLYEKYADVSLPFLPPFAGDRPPDPRGEIDTLRKFAMRANNGPGFKVLKKNYMLPNGNLSSNIVLTREATVCVARKGHKLILKVNGKVLAEEIYDVGGTFQAFIEANCGKNGAIRSISLSGTPDKEWQGWAEAEEASLQKAKKNTAGFIKGIRLTKYKDAEFKIRIKAPSIVNEVSFVNRPDVGPGGMIRKDKDRGGSLTIGVESKFYMGWDGFLLVPEDGEYKFFAAGLGNDKSVSIDDREIIRPGDRRAGATVKLISGMHKLNVKYTTNNMGYGWINLNWMKADPKMELYLGPSGVPIESQFLYHK